MVVSCSDQETEPVISNTPNQPEIQHTSTAIVFSDESPARTLLLHHRRLNRWQPPGGHQKPHELPHETAIRETREETGLNIEPYFDTPVRLDDRARSLPLPRYILEEQIAAYNEHPAHIHIDMVFVVTIPHETPILSPDEALEIGWFTLEAMRDLQLFENVRMTLEELFAERIHRG